MPFSLPLPLSDRAWDRLQMQKQARVPLWQTPKYAVGFAGTPEDTNQVLPRPAPHGEVLAGPPSLTRLTCLPCCLSSCDALGHYFLCRVLILLTPTGPSG